MTQKKINNHGAVERIYVEGTHEPIISVEVFEQAEKLRLERSVEKKDSNGYTIRTGCSVSKNVWARKCKCTCGHSFNRRLSCVNKNGTKSYLFQCYGQLKTGTPSSRLKKGLSVEGVCDNTSFMQWRLEVIADFIFKKLVANRQAIYEEALSMADDLKEYKRTDTREREKIEYNTRTIEKSKRQLEVLVDLCTNGDISVEVFRQKKKKLEDQIKKLEKSNNQYEQQISESGNDALRLERIESLGEFIKMEAFDPRAKIPETLIDAFVDRIIYDKGTFSWYLNPKLGNERFDIDTSTWKKSMLKKTNAGVVSSSGSYRRETVIESA